MDFESNLTIESAKVYKEDGLCYLKIVGVNDRIQFTIPKISLAEMVLKQESGYTRFENKIIMPTEMTCIATFNVLVDEDDAFLSMKKMPRKMTLSEIEEKLGYEVVLI